MSAPEGDRESLASAAPSPLGPGDHLRGEGPLLIVYADLACPRCAAAWRRIRGLPLRVCARHFPLAAKRPRAPVLHAATEAASLQDPAAFWPLWDGLLDDRGHSDDPHLWARAQELGLDLDRFERDRRSEQVAARVRRDFRDGIRAGVVGTPGVFHEGRLLPEPLESSIEAIAGV